MLFPNKYHERVKHLNGDDHLLRLCRTQNIMIKDDAEQLKHTGKTVQEEIAAIKTDITTELALSQSGKLESF